MGVQSECGNYAWDDSDFRDQIQDALVGFQIPVIFGFFSHTRYSKPVHRSAICSRKRNLNSGLKTTTTLAS